MPGQQLRRAFHSPRFPWWLLGAFALWFALWAIGPWHPKDFVLEHVLTVAFVGLLCWSYRSFRLSNFSYTCLFVFLCLHVVGAHYTYSEVPYLQWAVTAGSWLGIGEETVQAWVQPGRNHYDRMVHFMFGLTAAYPVREVFVRIVRVRGFWGYYLPLDVVMSFSMLYEVVEWLIALVFGGDMGQTYVGTQGDEWDAQKDMALATLGGLIAMFAAALVNWRYNRDFAAEWAASLSVHQSEPLGEVELAKLREQEPPK